jgi:acyl-coenzyme A thioesterase PaaI-like protein
VSGPVGMQGAFTESMGDLISYRYVGCQAEMIDPDHSVGTTALRSHLRTPGSVSGAALGISMLDAAGICVDRVHLLGLTQVDLQLYEPALDVERLRTFGSVVRWARSQVFTECRFEDADRPGHVLGAGAANWSVLAPTPEGFTYTDPGAGLPESAATPSMLEAFTVEPLAGGGLVVPALTTTVGAEVLHHGPMLVGSEHAALRAAAEATGTDALALASWSMRIVRAGRRAPFPINAEVVALTAEVVACRAELVDAEGDVVALSHLVFRR